MSDTIDTTGFRISFPKAERLKFRQVGFDEDTDNRLENLAHAKDVSVAEVVRQMVSYALERMVE